MTARDAVPLGLVLDMPFEDYLAVDALSATGLKLLARSAWHYRHQVPMAQTRPMLRGSLAHCAVLEPDALAKRYAVVPADAPRRPSKTQWTAKNPSPDSLESMRWWTKFQEDVGTREIVTADEFAIAQLQLQALAANPEIAELLRTGYSECSVFWTDPTTGVLCKARPDHVHPVDAKRVRLLDLKSTADESPSGFGRAAARMQYHLQRAQYVEGFERATGLEVVDFTFAAVTSGRPVLAVPYLLTDEIAEQGVDERRNLIDHYAMCLRENHWPAYGSGHQPLDFPAYAKRSTEVEASFVD